MTDFKPGDLVSGRTYFGDTFIGEYRSTRYCSTCGGDIASTLVDNAIEHLLLDTVRPAPYPDTSSDSATGDTPREKILAEAATLVTGDRNATYGAPTGNFQDTAAIWNVYLNHKLAEGQALTAGDVAAMMVGLKLARIKASPKKDNWADIAGYAACGYECDVNTGIIQEES